MSQQCEICGKKPVQGGGERRTGTRGFLKKRIRRTFNLNLRRVKLMTEDGQRRMRICAKCLKRLKKDQEDGVQRYPRLIMHQKFGFSTDTPL